MRRQRSDGTWEWFVRVVRYGGDPMGTEVTLDGTSAEPPKHLVHNGQPYERAETDHLGRYVYRSPRALRPREFRGERRR